MASDWVCESPSSDYLGEVQENPVSEKKAAPEKSKRNGEAVPRLETLRGRDELGRVTTLYKLDIASNNFDAQFTRAFQLSVASARNRNKRATRKTLASAAE